MHVTKWFANQPDVLGFWGIPTASIDWCEANYEISHYIAEFCNTLSNLVFVGLAVYLFYALFYLDFFKTLTSKYTRSGVKKCTDQGLPASLTLCHIGVAIVGIGSFLFHATLLYENQLLDELPMIYFSSFITYVSFDTSPTRSTFVTLLPSLLAGYDIGVTYFYLRWPNPVFHQVAYALIQITTTARVMYLLKTQLNSTPAERAVRQAALYTETVGSLTFLLGFLIWNLDNQFCGAISQWKASLNLPTAWLLEGHAHWHLLTGVGAYWIVAGIQLLALTLKEGPHFELKSGLAGLAPYVVRSSEKAE